MILSYDIELLFNYTLLLFTTTKTDNNDLPEQYLKIEQYNNDYFIDDIVVSKREACQSLHNTLTINTILNFNGKGYDNIIASLFVAGWENHKLKWASDEIIEKRALTGYNLSRITGVSLLDIDSVDLSPLAFGTAKLKVYGARLNVKQLLELPIPPDSVCLPETKRRLLRYCRDTDNAINVALLNEYRVTIATRQFMNEMYHFNHRSLDDLRSKGDAQIAESVIDRVFYRATNQKLSKPKEIPSSWLFIPPEHINFKHSSEFIDMFETSKRVKLRLSKAKKVVLPKELSRLFKVGNKTFKFGIGGIHSRNDQGSFYSTDTHVITEIDVSGMYPSIIDKNGYHPSHIPLEIWAKIYNQFIQNREDYKARLQSDQLSASERKALTDDIATMKIINNGAYGQLGNHYSKIFSPETLTNTTLTGQLDMLMLMDEIFNLQAKGKGMVVDDLTFERNADSDDFVILSANTDSITIRVKVSSMPIIKNVVNEWEEITKLKMEYTNYDSVHYQSGNSYFALKADGNVKRKGDYAKSGIRKNHKNQVCYDAVINRQLIDEPIEEYIRSVTDIAPFLILRLVTGGAMFEGQEIGSVVRWYHSASSDEHITYVSDKKYGDKVAMSDNSRPLMNMFDSDIEYALNDIDYVYYINEAFKVGLLCGSIDRYHVDLVDDVITESKSRVHLYTALDIVFVTLNLTLPKAKLIGFTADEIKEYRAHKKANK